MARSQSDDGRIARAEGRLRADVESKFIEGEVAAAAGQNGLAWLAHPAITQIQRSMADALNMAMSGALEPQEAAEVDEILLEY